MCMHASLLHFQKFFNVWKVLQNSGPPLSLKIYTFLILKMINQKVHLE